MRRIRKAITLIICFLFPVRIISWLLNLMGHSVSRSARIGFSIVYIDGLLKLEKGAKIGHFNSIRVNNLSIGERGYFGKMNAVAGPLDVVLASTAAIGNDNRIRRGPTGVTYGPAVLKLGVLSKITGNHRLDCTRSITIGDYTTLAGHESQLWTHSYYHDPSGPGRFRVDGEIEIGNNVYIGSRCVITGGVKIADTVVVGANVCVSRSLTERGTYVNQPLRHIPGTPEDPRLKFTPVNHSGLVDKVYEKKINQ